MRETWTEPGSPLTQISNFPWFILSCLRPVRAAALPSGVVVWVCAPKTVGDGVFLLRFRSFTVGNCVSRAPMPTPMWTISRCCLEKTSEVRSLDEAASYRWLSLILLFILCCFVYNWLFSIYILINNNKDFRKLLVKINTIYHQLIH